MVRAIPHMTLLVLVGGALTLCAGCGPGITVTGSATGGATGSGGAAPGTPPGGSGTGGTGGASGGTTGMDPDAAAQLCVDTINMYRATLNLAPYTRWTDQESCSSNEALSDSQTGTAHGAFGMCMEGAQDECPGWGGSLESIVTGCLKQMWDEGPGTDFNSHGHYINMSSSKYTRAACGFSTGSNGKTWAVQNFR